MRKIVILLMLFCLSSVFAFQSRSDSASNEDSIKQAVLRVHQQMTDAGPDVDKFFDCILDFDNGMILQDGTMFRTRKQAYDAVKEGYQGVSNVARTYDQTFVTVISSETSLLTATGVTKITLTDGRTFDSSFAVSMVFVLRDGQWKMLHGHYSVPNPR